MSVRELVTRLREAAGESGEAILDAERPDAKEAAPCWYQAERITETVRADEILAEGGHLLGVVQDRARRPERGAILRLHSSFRPEPLIQVMRERGMAVWSREAAPGVQMTDFCRL